MTGTVRVELHCGVQDLAHPDRAPEIRDDHVSEYQRVRNEEESAHKDEQGTGDRHVTEMVPPELSGAGLALPSLP